MTDIKFWSNKNLYIDDGTSAGVSTVDPNRNSDFNGIDRWEWTWYLADQHLDPAQQLVQTFDATGLLLPGTWFSEAAVETEESNNNGQEVAATSAATAPIEAVRVYDIHVDYFGTQLDLEALLDESGVTPLTWVES